MNKVPKTLLREVVALTTTSTCRQQTIYLLGTCHVSAKSCADVRLLISSVQPKAVFLELCKSRREVLDDNFSRDYRQQGSKLKDLSYSEIVQKLRSGELNLFTLAYSIILRSISNELNITPGGEFKAAYDCALALPTRAYVVLGDRDVDITINRLWNGLTAMQKIQLIGHVVYQSFSGDSWNSFSDDLEAKIEDFKQDRSKIFDEFNRVLGDKFPWVVEALVNERDVFMMLELRKVVCGVGTGQRWR
jgi:pheromone shutdown protein TraB